VAFLILVVVVAVTQYGANIDNSFNLQKTLPLILTKWWGLFSLIMS
jgi:hypothetical protein